MIDNIKRTLKHSVVYGLGNLSSKLIGIILLPLYTTNFSTAQFGQYGIFEVILFLLPILSLGLPFSLQRWLGLSEFKSQRGSILFTVTIFLTVYLILLFIIISPLVLTISKIFLDEPALQTIIIVLFAISFFDVLNSIVFVLMRMKEKSILFSISNSLKFIVQLIAIVYSIKYLNMGIAGIFWAELLATFLLFLILFPYLFKNFTFQFNKTELIAMIKFGIPSLFGNYTVNFINYSDRNLLSLFVSNSALGIYLLGYKIANIIGTFIITSFNAAFPAIAWPQVGTDGENRFFSKMFTYFSFILIWSSLFLAIYSKGIVHQFALDASYWPAAEVVPLLTLGLVFNGMTTILSYGILITKQTSKIPLISAISLVMNIVLNLMLVPILSYFGTAIANLVTYILRAGATHIFSRQQFKVNWEFRKIGLMLLVACFLYFFSLVFDPLSFLIRTSTKAIILISFPILLYFFKFFEPVEISTMKLVLTKLSKGTSNEKI